MKKITIGFDVYGTLVNPIEVSSYLHELVGDKNKLFAEIWRQKQLEYTFRRGLMNQYQNFDICTQHALQYTIDFLNVSFTNHEKDTLLKLYVNLKLYPDVLPALESLNQSHKTLVAFSNGVRSTLKTLLTNAKIIDHIEDIISVDKLRTFKPNPKVYEYLATKTGTNPDNCWVASSNSFDVIGAKCAGLKAAWIQRDPNNIFDTWEYEPDIKAKDLIEFTSHLK